ncbi:hypothetical protein [Paratractidigestivibacter faecalis]|uniref:hypothetical protein n=1 Tax=Paratractidigestivibacter faecalis TaxID=2292441 RepID=UPI000E3C970A|nr:hypothetical protein [Paratractidigestivibacter faecalis]
MAFINDVDGILRRYETDRNVLLEKRDRVEPSGYRSRAALEAMRAEHAEEVDAELARLLDTTRERLDAALDGYVSGLSSRYTKTPETIDAADLALLTSGVSLSAQDVQAMYGRCKNDAMREVVAAYEAEHQTGAGVTFFSQEQRAEAAREYAAAARDAVGKPDGLAFAMLLDGKAVPDSLTGE